MLEVIKNRFSFTYESGASASYLVATVNGVEKIHSYQVEMIANNPNPGILPLDMRQKDGIISLHYNITSKLALSQFLKRKKLKRNEFLEILLSITKVLLESTNYLLSDKSFLVSEEYIYINPYSLETSLIYFPITMEIDTAMNFKDFVLKLIMFSADIDESGSDNFLQRILNQVKMEPFNLLEFDKLLKELKNSGLPQRSSNSVNQAMDSGVTLAKNSKENTINPKVEVAKAIKPALQKPDAEQERVFAHQTQQKSPIPPAPTAVPIPNKQQAVQRPVKSEQTKLQYKTSTIIIAAIIQVGIIAALGVIYISGALKALGEDTTTSLAAIAIISGAIDFLILRSLLDKKNMVVKQDEGKTSTIATAPGQVNISKREIRNVPESPRSSNPDFNRDASSESREYKDLHKMPQVLDATTVLSSDTGNKTMLLGQGGRKYPYLQAKKNGMVEEIVINKASFIIGRLREQVDYVSTNNAVGKVHAEIISRDDGYYIKDLNSRNGTFINDVRIESNKQCQINSNDKITFANSDFIFIIP